MERFGELNERVNQHSLFADLDVRDGGARNRRDEQRSKLLLRKFLFAPK